MMKHFLRLIEGIVVMPTMAAVARRGDLWRESALILRADSRYLDSARAVPTAAQMALDIMQLLRGSQLNAIGLFRLGPKETCEHHGPEDAAFTRYYIMLQSLAPGVFVTCGDETVQPKTGDCWWMDHGNNAEQTVEMRNKSDDDFISMAFDIRVDTL